MAFAVKFFLNHVASFVLLFNKLLLSFSLRFSLLNFNHHFDVLGLFLLLFAQQLKSVFIHLFVFLSFKSLAKSSRLGLHLIDLNVLGKLLPHVKMHLRFGGLFLQLLILSL